MLTSIQPHFIEPIQTFTHSILLRLCAYQQSLLASFDGVIPLKIETKDKTVPLSARKNMCVFEVKHIIAAVLQIDASDFQLIHPNNLMADSKPLSTYLSSRSRSHTIQLKQCMSPSYLIFYYYLFPYPSLSCLFSFHFDSSRAPGIQLDWKFTWSWKGKNSTVQCIKR